MSPHQNSNKMGKWGATSYIIGNIVGSGIFMTPNSVLRETDSSVGVALVVWTISAVVSTLGALCYVELGTRIRKSGADFAYLNFVKWRSFAFAFVCCGCVLLFPVILAIQAETFAEYLLEGLQLQFCTSETKYIAKKLISFSTIWLLLFLNFFSVQKFVAKFQILASIAKILSCIIVMATGLYVLCFTEKRASNLANPFNNWQKAINLRKLTNAFFAGLYSYDGWDVLNFGMEDLKNPRSSLKFAIVFGMSAVGGVFIAMNLSFFIVLDASQIYSSDAVATTFAQHSLGSYRHIVPLLVSIVLIGSMNSTMFSASRYLFAASRGGAFPPFVSCTNEAHDSPRAALFLHVILAMCFSFLGNLDDLLNHVGFAQWIQRSLTIAALLYIRYRSSRGRDFNFPKDYLKTPLLIPLVFFASCLLLVIVTITEHFYPTATITLIVISVGFIVYFLFVDERFEAINNFRKNSSVFMWIFSINEKLCQCSQIFFNGLVDVSDPDEEEDRYEKSLTDSDINSSCKPVDNHNNVVRKFTRKDRVHDANNC